MRVTSCKVVASALMLMGAAANASAAPAPGNSSDDSGIQAYHSGNGLLNRGHYQLAIAEYQSFLSAHPDHDKAPLARYGLAVCLFRLNRLDDAAETLAPLTRHSGFEFAAEVAVMLGQCRLAAHHYQQALESFEAVVNNFHNHPLADDAAAQSVEALYLNNQFDKAAARSKDFASRWPDSPQRDRADYFGGMAKMQSKVYKSAGQQFAGLLKTHPRSPFAPHAALLLARCLHNQGDFPAAARQYDVVLGQQKNPYRPEALLGQATLLRRDRKHEQAGKLLDQLLKEYPSTALADSARLLRGRTWFDLGDYDAAVKTLVGVEQSKDRTLAGEAAYWSAKCRLRQNDHVAAAKDFKEAIDAYPDSALQPEMRYDRAVALLRSGDQAAAAKTLVDFRSRFPKHALAPQALHLLASIAHQQEDYKQSLNYAERFLEDYPDHALAPEVAFLSSENRYLSGEYEKAVNAYRRFLDKHGDNPRARIARYRLGMALYRLSNLDEAWPLLSQIHPKDDEATQFGALSLALGDICFHRGQWKQAEAHLRTYLAGKPTPAAADEALLKLGLALQRQNKHQAAIERYDRLLAEFPESPHALQALFERGQVLVALKKLDAAAQSFDKVLAQGDDTRFATPARRHLAAISLTGGEFSQAAERFALVARSSSDAADRAEAQFQQGQALMAAQDFKAADKALKTLIAEAPSHQRIPAAKANRAIALSRQDRHKAALELIAQIKPAKLDAPLAASVLYEKAWCLRALGNVSEAAQAYRKLIQAQPGGQVQAHALVELADVHADDRQFAKAVELLDQLHSWAARSNTRIEPEIAEEAGYRLGTCLFKLKEYDRAARVLSEFVASYPKSKLLVSASFFCGEALFAMDKQAGAVEHFRRVLAGPQSDPACGPSLLRLGECYAHTQQWADSEKAFAEYLDRFGSSEPWFTARFGLGWALENQGRLDDAMDSYQQVVSRHKGPTAARAQFQIGQCLFGKKQYEDAARELLKVDILYGYPEWSAAALYEAGRCFEMLAKTAEARQQFQTVLDQYKETQWAQLAAGRLEGLTKRSLPGH